MQIEYYIYIGEVNEVKEILENYDFSDYYSNTIKNFKEIISSYEELKKKLIDEINENLSRDNYEFLISKMEEIIKFYKTEPSIIMEYIKKYNSHLIRKNILENIKKAEDLINQKHFDTAYEVLNSLDISRSEDETLNSKYLELLNLSNKGIKALEIIKQIMINYNNGNFMDCYFLYEKSKNYNVIEIINDNLKKEILEEIKNQENIVKAKINELKEALNSYDLIISEKILTELNSINAPSNFFEEYHSLFKTIKDVVLETNTAENLYFNGNLAKAREIVNKNIKKHKSYKKLANLKKMIDEKISSTSAILKQNSKNLIDFLENAKHDELNQLLVELGSMDINGKDDFFKIFKQEIQNFDIGKLKESFFNYAKKFKYNENLLLLTEIFYQTLDQDEEITSFWKKLEYLDKLYKEMDNSIKEIINKFSKHSNTYYKNISNSLKQIHQSRKYDSAIIVLKLHLKKHPDDDFIKPILEKLSNFNTQYKKLND